MDRVRHNYARSEEVVPCIFFDGSIPQDEDIEAMQHLDVPSPTLAKLTEKYKTFRMEESVEFAKAHLGYLAALVTNAHISNVAADGAYKIAMSERTEIHFFAFANSEFE